MISIEETQELLDEIAESLPHDFYRDLNGGILLLPEEKPSPYSVDGDLWILGEYQRGGLMGRLIKIYYGSFARMFPNAGKDRIADQLRETLLHEFTHHLESLAGERGLEVWDEEQLARYFESKKK